MQHGKIKIDLSTVSETLLASLWARAKISREHNSLLSDAKAIELVEHIDYDFSTIEKVFRVNSRTCERTLSTSESLACDSEPFKLELDSRENVIDDNINDSINLPDLPRAVVHRMIMTGCSIVHALQESSA